MKFLAFLILILIHSSAFAIQKIKWGIDKELYYHIKVAREFSEKIKDYTKGEIVIEIETFDTKDIKQTTREIIQSGRFQMAQGPVQEFVGSVPELNVWNMPFLFESFEHVEKYINSDHAKTILAKLNQQTVMTAIDYTFSGGPLVVISKNRMESFKDFTGQELSLTDDSKFYDDFLKNDGLKPRREGDIKLAAQAEVLAAGIDAIFVREDAYALWVNITHHRVISRFVFVANPTLASMSSKNREYFMSELKKLMIKERQLSRQGAEIGKQLLVNRGTNVNVWTRNQKINELNRWSIPVEEYKNKYTSELKFIDSLNPNKPFMFDSVKLSQK